MLKNQLMKKKLAVALNVVANHHKKIIFNKRFYQMNMIEKFFSYFESKCGVDYCNTTYAAGDQKIVNNYKCNQRQFSYFDHCKIQKEARPAAVKSGLFIH